MIRSPDNTTRNLNGERNQRRRVISRNLVFAVIFVAWSVATGFHAYRNMTVGTAAEMGPGFFPLMLSIVLGLLSLGVAFTAVTEHIQPLRMAPLRAIVLVLGAPLLFALTIRSLGLVIAVALTVFLTSFASRFATLRNSCFSPPDSRSSVSWCSAISSAFPVVGQTARRIGHSRWIDFKSGDRLCNDTAAVQFAVLLYWLFPGNGHWRCCRVSVRSARLPSSLPLTFKFSPKRR